MLKLLFTTFTGEYEPAVSNSINLVPDSISTYLKLRPFVLTFLPEGKFLLLRLLSTKVFPLSYKPTTATIAPSHIFYSILSDYYYGVNFYKFFFPIIWFLVVVEEVSKNCFEKLIFQPY